MNHHQEVIAGVQGLMAKTHSDARALIKRIEGAGREPTPSEQRQLDKLFEQFEVYDRELKALDAESDEAEAMAALAALPRGRKTSPMPLYAGPGAPANMTAAFPRTAAPARIPPVIDMAAPVRQPSHAALFGTAAARGELSFTNVLGALVAGDSQTLRSITNANLSTTGADGGFAVGTAIGADLLNSVVQQSQFLRYCRVLPLAGQSTTFPVINDTDRSKGPGDLTAEKVTEGTAATRQTVKFRELTLTARKAMVYWSTSSEMIQDSVPGTPQAMVDSAASTLAMAIDREIWAGTGVGQGLGVTNAPCSIVHAKDGGQSASTVTYTNLSGMVSRLLPSSWNNALWVIHPSALTALFGVYLATGASGGIPLPLSQGPDGSYRLFGRPMVVSDFAAPLSSQGDVALVDLSFMAVGFREDLRFEVSRDHLFSSDEVAYRIVQRRDLMPVLPSAVTPARGSTTLSPFVVLQAR